MVKIEIYPECEKPKWLMVGAWCYVLGEAQQKFIINKVVYNDKAVVLIDEEGYAHGIESITKCYQTMSELEKRRGWNK